MKKKQYMTPTLEEIGIKGMNLLLIASRRVLGGGYATDIEYGGEDDEDLDPD